MHAMHRNIICILTVIYDFITHMARAVMAKILNIVFSSMICEFRNDSSAIHVRIELLRRLKYYTYSIVGFQFSSLSYCVGRQERWFAFQTHLHNIPLKSPFELLVISWFVRLALRANHLVSSKGFIFLRKKGKGLSWNGQRTIQANYGNG